MEIMKLKPAGKDYLWGGSRLRKEYGKDIPLQPLAETWECSIHPDGLSVIVNGSYAGRTLADVLKLHPEYIGPKALPGDELPILVKFIDAKENLSVQVHPDDAYAREYEHQNGKTEMWYVLDAQDDASLIYGFEHPVTKDLLRDSINNGSLDKHLHKVKVKRGDVYYVPAGTVHGIGAGTLLAEIQQSSNVSYRIYDYDRIDKDGKKRELHFDKAVNVMNMNAVLETNQKSRLVHYYPGCSREILCRSRYFETERIEVTTECSLGVIDTSFQVLLCINGKGRIETDENETVKFAKGDCLFIPSGIGKCYLSGKIELLKIRC